MFIPFIIHCSAGDQNRGLAQAKLVLYSDLYPCLKRGLAIARAGLSPAVLPPQPLSARITGMLCCIQRTPFGLFVFLSRDL